jgi:alpha-ketoglutarate-dependent taurine dioxygenase
MNLTTSAFLDRLSTHNFLRSDTLLVEDVAFDPDEFLNGLGRFGFTPIASSDGLVSTVREAYDPVDFNKQSGNFDFHTDGLYYTAVPEFVLLYCISPGNGMTRTAFADTRPVARAILENRDLSFLQHTEIVWVGKDAVDYAQPLLHPHPRTGEPVLHATGRGFVRPRVTTDQIAHTPSLREFITMQERLLGLLDQNICERHEWRRHEALLFDNCTFIHARESLGDNPDRELLRIWFSRDSVRSDNRKR